MSREIKFRAWDEQAKEWNKKYSINAGGEHNPLREMYDWEALKEYSMDILDGDNQFDIMQFTGLKDKNGIEIYEGDIIEAKERRYFFGTNMGLQTIRFKSPIVYEDAGFVYSTKQENDSALIVTNDIKVIGNIYQNPELLNTNPPKAGKADTK